jgi:UDP-galactopyranose mutase
MVADKKYDYLIVGSGFYGSVCAYELSRIGKKVLVIEKRNHIGGNAYTRKEGDIDVHEYGAHIFHTNDRKIWKWIQQFGEFNNFRNSPLANYKGEIYSLPFSMWTFYKLWGVTTPDEAKKIIESQRYTGLITNLEEQALSLVGKDVYEKLIKGYTEKQWKKEAKLLPASIIKRLPVRFTWDNNYFNDKYQGIPIDGYTSLFEKMLEGIPVELNTDYLKDKDYWNSKADNVIYTGPIDAYFNYQHGDLEYKTVKFKTRKFEETDFQGNAVVNYTEAKIPHTRIIEHKHFNFKNQKDTIVSWEYPVEYRRGLEPYYPVNDETNLNIYKKYKDEADSIKNVFFGGRLAEYKYYDMHQVIASALSDLKNYHNIPIN